MDQSNGSEEKMQPPWVKWIYRGLIMAALAGIAGLAMLIFDPADDSTAARVIGISAAATGILSGAFFAIWGFSIIAWYATPAEKRKQGPKASKTTMIYIILGVIGGGLIGTGFGLVFDGDGLGQIIGSWVGGVVGAMIAYSRAKSPKDN